MAKKPFFSKGAVWKEDTGLIYTLNDIDSFSRYTTFNITVSNEVKGLVHFFVTLYDGGYYVLTLHSITELYGNLYVVEDADDEDFKVILSIPGIRTENSGDTSDFYRGVFTLLSIQRSLESFLRTTLPRIRKEYKISKA